MKSAKTSIIASVCLSLMSVSLPAFAQESGDAWIGSYFRTRNAAALVEGVVPGSPAEKAGLQAGDMITSIDGNAVGSGDDAMRMVAKSAEGTVLSCVVQREDEALKIPIKVGLQGKSEREKQEKRYRTFDAQKIQVSTNTNRTFYYYQGKYDPTYQYKGSQDELEVTFRQGSETFGDWWVYSDLDDRVSRFPECDELCNPIRQARGNLNLAVTGYGAALGGMILGIGLIPVSNDLGAAVFGVGTLGGIAVGCAFHVMYLASQTETLHRAMDVAGEYNRQLWKETMGNAK